MHDRRVRQGSVTDMTGRNSCDRTELKKPHIYSGLPAMTKLCLHSTHDSSQTELRQFLFRSPATVSALVQGRFHTCNFGMDQTKEVGTSMTSSESTARFLRSTCADQTSIYCINNGCEAWISSLHAPTSAWAHTVTGVFTRCDLWYRVCYFRIRVHRWSHLTILQALFLLANVSHWLLHVSLLTEMNS